MKCENCEGTYDHWTSETEHKIICPLCNHTVVLKSSNNSPTKPEDIIETLFRLDTDEKKKEFSDALDKKFKKCD